MSEPPLLLDNSAWARLATGDVAEATAAMAAEWIRARRLVVSLPFLLEAGYSARTAADYGFIMERLLALPYAALDAEAERHALEAQRELAATAHHRLPPVDVLVAALAHRHGYGVLHADHHYDLICEHSALNFDSVWLTREAT